MNDQDALRSAAARKERRTSLIFGAALMFAGSAGEPLYRGLDAPLLAVRVVWCVMLALVGAALPRASSRLCGVLLPLAGLGSCWLYAITVWLNGGTASPDFQYLVLLPLVHVVLFQDEVIAVAATVVGTVSAALVLLCLGDAQLAVAANTLSTDAAIGIVAVWCAYSFRRVRIAELTTQRARADALEQLALSEHRRAQTERLASLGQLAAGVAHEINNPLYAVSANLEILGESGLSCPGLSGGQMQSLLDDVQLGVGRMTQIVKDLKEFSSGGTDALQPCRIDEVIGDALRLASFKLGKAIEVRRSCAVDLPPVTVNRRKLSQVLLNLLVNAADAMAEACTEKPWVLVDAGQVGDAIQIAVQDNGPGISADIAAQLFEPFVTREPIGKGTGLGLALSREYLASFGGTLEHQPVSSGTRFSIRLPTGACA